MNRTRLEAFSDGVLAIIIIIMVLEIRVPHGNDFKVLQPLIPLVGSNFFSQRISGALYVLVALIWLIPLLKDMWWKRLK